ncbi:MAG: DUF72 domain-containing protein [Saprospiraceae bacterium]|nr:DUF72 domain-containing protein [Saprospiraceae bacterium]
MEFGKVENLSDILWNLPPKPNIGVVKNSKPIHFHIGTTGWAEKEWVGSIYPKGTKPADYLSQYAKVFDSIELNTTHYQIPDHLKIERWYDKSAPDFKFCPKLPRAISHHKGLGNGTDNILLFCESISGLKEKLGPCFLQLPPYFSPDNLDILETFFQKWPKEIALHLEFRHEDWYLPTTIDKLIELLIHHQKGMVMTDVAGRRDVLAIGATTDVVFVRFVGNLGHPSDGERLKQWVITLNEWVDAGIQEIYFFLHQPQPKAILPMYEYIKGLQIATGSFQNMRELKSETEDPKTRQLKLF